jgi:hypothetical protein
MDDAFRQLAGVLAGIQQAQQQQQLQQQAMHEQFMNMFVTAKGSNKGKGKGDFTANAFAAATPVVSDIVFRSMDTRGVGRPLELTEDDAKNRDHFRRWTMKLSAWYADQWPDAEQVLKDVALRQTEVVTLDALSTYDINHHGSIAFSKSLRSLLIHLCQGETFTVATTGVVANDAAGLESYRRLVRKYDPQGGDMELKQLRRILKSAPTDCHRLKAEIEDTEEQVRLWNLRNPDDGIPGFIQRLVLNDKCTEPLRTHLDLRLSSLKDYQSLRDEIFKYLLVLESKDLSAKTTSEGGNAMEVDELQWINESEALDEDEREYVLAALAKAKGKGKGKGKSGKPSSSQSSSSSPSAQSFPPCRGCKSTKHHHSHCWVLHPELKASYNKKNISSSSGSSSNSKAGGNKGGKGGKGGTKPLNELLEEDGDDDGYEEEEEANSNELQAFDIVDLSHMEICSLPAAIKQPSWFKKMKDGRVLVLFGVDSCAAANAVPPSVAPLLAVVKTPTQGVRQFKAASGQLLPDLGDRVVAGRSQSGRGFKINMTITPVVKPLLSVASLSAKGCRCELGDAENSWLHLPGGGRERLHIIGQVYVLPLFLDASTGGVDEQSLYSSLEGVFQWQVAAP